MRLLLDSNILLWMLSDRKRLTRRVFDLVGDDEQELFVSRASLWEISIKVTKGKLTLPGSSIRSLLTEIEHLGIAVLSIENADILRTGSLPHHHKDPFDRMLIAQALERELTILTADSEIPLYAVPVIWK